MTETQTIARHATTDGYSIAILAERNAFRIVRADAQGTYITFDWAKNEKAARQIANRLWLRDMGREQMIGCGTSAI